MPTVRGRTISHSERMPIAAHPTMTDAMLVAVIPVPCEIHPTTGETSPATPKFVAPMTDAAVPAACLLYTSDAADE